MRSPWELTPDEAADLHARILAEMIATADRAGADTQSDGDIAAALHVAGYTANEIARNWPEIERHFALAAVRRVARLEDWAVRVTQACTDAQDAIAKYLAEQGRPISGHKDGRVG